MTAIPHPKPCPKCDMEDIEVFEIDGWQPYWRAVCIHCGYEGASQPSIREAVDFWNREE